MGGGCRFKLSAHPHYYTEAEKTAENFGIVGGSDGSKPKTPLDVAASEEVRKVFRSGVDYWQRKHHRHHSPTMKEDVVLVLLLIRQRLDAQAGPARVTATTAPTAPTVPTLPARVGQQGLSYAAAAKKPPPVRAEQQGLSYAAAAKIGGTQTSSTSARHHVIAMRRLPRLPEEIWLEVAGFLRSADFDTAADAAMPAFPSISAQDPAPFGIDV